jgi:hypothetical protein
MKICKRGHQRTDDIVGCAECRKITSKAWYHNNIEEKRKYMKEHSNARYRLKKSEYKDKKRLRLYGISPDEYQAMILTQNNVCAICIKKSDKTLCVDHCHATTKVRGLLCHSCNKGLGVFGDSIENLERAITYLRRNK